MIRVNDVAAIVVIVDRYHCFPFFVLCSRTKRNGGLPISRVAPLDQLLPFSLGSSEDSKDFLSNNCSIRTRYLHFNTIFPKSTVMQLVNI